MVCNTGIDDDNDEFLRKGENITDKLTTARLLISVAEIVAVVQ